MNREIKFRVWDLENKNYTKFDLINRKTTMAPLFTEFVDYKFVIQQFTGLKDRNGKEIYEGDIVCEIMTDEMAANGEESTVGQVFFAAGAFMIDDADILFNHIYGNSPNVLEDFYVIGNIFENKELMK